MDENLKKLFSRKLTMYLASAGKTQADLSKYIGVSSATVSDWCNAHKMPRTDKIQSICNWLGIEIADLLTDAAVRDLSPSDDYSEQEKLLVEYFRQASPEIQQLVLAALHVPEGKNQDSARAV